MNKITLLTVTLFFAATTAYAQDRGNEGGGGGNAVVCYKSVQIKNTVLENIRQSDVGVSTLSEADLELDQLSQPPILADLYEGGTTRGLMVKSQPPDPRSAESVYAAIAKIDSRFWALFSPGISKDIQWIGNDSGVITVRDAFFVNKFPANCTVVQAAYYDDTTNTIHYDTRIVGKMDRRNLVALKIHEDLYHFYRGNLNQLKTLASSREGYVATIAFLGMGDVELSTESQIPKLDMGSLSNSDKVRPLVAYLMNENVFRRDDFQPQATRLAIGSVSSLAGNWICQGYTGNCAVIGVASEKKSTGLLRSKTVQTVYVREMHTLDPKRNYDDRLGWHDYVKLIPPQ